MDFGLGTLACRDVDVRHHRAAPLADQVLYAHFGPVRPRPVFPGIVDDGARALAAKHGADREHDARLVLRRELQPIEKDCTRCRSYARVARVHRVLPGLISGDDHAGSVEDHDVASNR